MITQELQEALTELAKEISTSLRERRDREDVSLYSLKRWRNDIATLLEEVKPGDGGEPSDRTWYAVKEGVLDELDSILFPFIRGDIERKEDEH